MADNITDLPRQPYPEEWALAATPAYFDQAHCLDSGKDSDLKNNSMEPFMDSPGSFNMPFAMSEMAISEDVSSWLPTPSPTVTRTFSTEEVAWGKSVGDATTGHGTVLVSTTFHPTAGIDSALPDLIIITHDGVCFYLHSHRLLSASDNGFGGLLPTLSVYPLHTSESAAVFNVAVHAVYGLAFSQYESKLSDICDAVNALARYGAMGVAAPGTFLYQVLTSHIPDHPFEVYKLAGAHSLDELAVAASAHLHSLPLWSVSDEDASRVGAVYLRRLFFLHLGRTEALKRLLAVKPKTHRPTATCRYEQQVAVNRAWAVATAYLSWGARADTSPEQISTAFLSLESSLTCSMCCVLFKERVKELLLQWSLIKTTI